MHASLIREAGPVAQESAGPILSGGLGRQSSTACVSLLVMLNGDGIRRLAAIISSCGACSM